MYLVLIIVLFKCEFSWWLMWFYLVGEMFGCDGVGCVGIFEIVDEIIFGLIVDFVLNEISYN